MREIKFRAWNEDDSNPKERMILPATLTCEGKVIMPDGEDHIMPVMQYTGLKDKHEKEIYEGDIVEYSNFNGHQFRRVVVYLAPNFVLSPSINEKIAVDTFSTPNIHETIIGNIYENPELI